MKRRRPLCAAAVLGTASTILAVLPGGAALAAAATLTVSPSFGPPASVTTVAGSGFCPDGKVVLRFAGRSVGRAAVDAAGHFRAPVTVPADAPPGPAAVRAAEAGCASANTSFLVRSNVRQAGATAIENYLSPANVGRLAPAWSVSRNRVLGPPSIVNGVAYYGSYGDSVGSTITTVYAADARTGEPVWQAAAYGPVVAQPAVANGTVYVGSRTGGVYALDAGTGATRWSAGAGGEVDGPVQVARGLVYVPVSNGGDTHDAGRVVALDAATGAKRWTFDFGLYPTSPLSIGGGTVYFGAADGFAYALDADTGAQRWAVQTGVGQPSVSLGTGVVYVSFADGVHGLAPRTGADRGLVQPPVASINGVVYEISGSTLIARDAATGAQLVALQLPGDGHGVTVVNGAVYVATEAGLSVFTVGGALPRA